MKVRAGEAESVGEGLVLGGDAGFELGVVGLVEDFFEEGPGWEAGGGEVVAGDERRGGVVGF